MKCCICTQEIEVVRNDKGDVIWDRGNDAMPVKNGRCCNRCDQAVVHPFRMGRQEEAMFNALAIREEVGV
jgi:hypothetical protein